MPPNANPLVPHSDHRSSGIRKLYIQNLTDLLHVCLLRGEIERARRAWAILVRVEISTKQALTISPLSDSLPPGGLALTMALGPQAALFLLSESRDE